MHRIHSDDEAPPPELCTRKGARCRIYMCSMCVCPSKFYYAYWTILARLQSQPSWGTRCRLGAPLVPRNAVLARSAKHVRVSAPRHLSARLGGHVARADCSSGRWSPDATDEVRRLVFPVASVDRRALGMRSRPTPVATGHSPRARARMPARAGRSREELPSRATTPAMTPNLRARTPRPVCSTSREERSPDATRSPPQALSSWTCNVY